ncbi:helix-turn-helix domain-containing protein [Plantibacter sp. YIM 135347]|uniref:helix-turn-helix domain-containing protein n=1 Tax=Plantibacter sp. YIM 135347 TaxID=3423919 RepID=UPI003D335FF5
MTASQLSLTDPKVMRALSHPIRLRLLGELRVRGPQTVGLLSGAVDEAPGLVSYHLGVLAEHELVVEVPELARDKRERWWRAAHDRTHWDAAEHLDDPERRTALTALRGSVQRRYTELLQEYLELEPTLPAAWVRAATSGDEILHLTSAQLAELGEDLEALARKWASLSDRDADGAADVALIYHSFRR